MQCLRYFLLLLTMLIATPTVQITAMQPMQTFPLTTISIINAHKLFDVLRKHLVMQASSNYQLAKADPHYFTKLIENDNFRQALDALHPEKRATLYAYFQSLQHKIHANPANPAEVGHAYTQLFNYFAVCSKDLQSRSYLLRQMQKGAVSFSTIDEFNTYQKQHDQTHNQEKEARKAAKYGPGITRAQKRDVKDNNNDQNQPDSDDNASHDTLNDPDNNNTPDDENMGFWRGIFAWIMQNKLKAAAIGVGAGLTIYGVLAKIMNWWPFNEPVEQGQQQPIPAAAP